MATRRHVDIEEGLVYAPADAAAGRSRDLLCDVYRPDGVDGPLPAVVLIHGGGWRQGDRTQLRGYGIMIGREGYVCVAPEYRLIPDGPWPAALDDARAAFAWVLDNADRLGIDPARVAVEGNSAGAHLALLLAADATLPVRACLAVYPPTLLTHGEWEDGGVPLLALADDGGTPDLAHAASPLRHVTPDFPPTQLIHGSADEVVPVAASLLLFDELRRQGVPVDLHIHAEQLHAFDVDPLLGRVTAAEMLGFLQRYV